MKLTLFDSELKGGNLPFLSISHHDAAGNGNDSMPVLLRRPETAKELKRIARQKFDIAEDKRLAVYIPAAHFGLGEDTQLEDEVYDAVKEHLVRLVVVVTEGKRNREKEPEEVIPRRQQHTPPSTVDDEQEEYDDYRLPEDELDAEEGSTTEEEIKPPRSPMKKKPGKLVLSEDETEPEEDFETAQEDRSPRASEATLEYQDDDFQSRGDETELDDYDRAETQDVTTQQEEAEVPQVREALHPPPQQSSSSRRTSPSDGAKGYTTAPSKKQATPEPEPITAIKMERTVSHIPTSNQANTARKPASGSGPAPTSSSSSSERTQSQSHLAQQSSTGSGQASEKEAFLVVISHPASGHEIRCKVRTRSLIKKVIDGASKGLKLDSSRAQLFIVSTAETDGISMEVKTKCERDETVGRLGITERSRLEIVLA